MSTLSRALVPVVPLVIVVVMLEPAGAPSMMTAELLPPKPVVISQTLALMGHLPV